MSEAELARHFGHASALARAGETDAARTEYFAVLQQDPKHLDALNDLGTLLHGAGYRAAARRCYEEAIAHHPDAAKPRVNLANMLLEDGGAEDARRHYATAIDCAPTLAEAHQGLALALAELGEDHAAARHRDLGFRDRYLIERPYRGTGDGVPLLLLVSSTGGNLPARVLVDDRVFRVSAVVADYFPEGHALPAHRLVLNAIGDADVARGALEAAASLVARTSAPVVNAPGAVLATGRIDNARRLAAIPGVVAPRMAMVPRAALAAEGSAYLAARGFAFPLLLRRTGFHTGRFFARVERPQDLDAALAALPGSELAAIQFLDARGSDGLTRKYRVMAVDGRLYPLHLAIAKDWKVHYFSSAMAERADHRDEEARFLADMTATIGAKANAALERIAALLGLDYGGVDFGLDADGNVLLFEANATMVVNPPDPDPRWDYRRAPTAAILDAARALMTGRMALEHDRIG